MASPTATATATPALPETGGSPPALVLGPLAMFLGGGLVAFSFVRRSYNTAAIEGEAFGLSPSLCALCPGHVGLVLSQWGAIIRRRRYYLILTYVAMTSSILYIRRSE